MPFPKLAPALAGLRNIYAAFRDRAFTLAGAGEGDVGSVKTDMPNSTAIDWIEYSVATSKLLVRFKRRPRHPTYIYDNVPRLVWLGWLKAGSKGVYYHRSVKRHSNLV